MCLFFSFKPIPLEKKQNFHPEFYQFKMRNGEKMKMETRWYGAWALVWLTEKFTNKNPANKIFDLEASSQFRNERNHFRTRFVELRIYDQKIKQPKKVWSQWLTSPDQNRTRTLALFQVVIRTLEKWRLCESEGKQCLIKKTYEREKCICHCHRWWWGGRKDPHQMHASEKSRYSWW